MGIIYEEKDQQNLLGGKPVRVNRYKDGEALVYNKLKEHWQAETIVGTGATGGDVLLATTYDEAATTGILICSQYDPTA